MTGERGGAVATSNDPYRDLVEGLAAAVWQAEPVPFKFTFVSRGAEQMLGFPRARWVEEEDFWRGRVHPDDRERLIAAWWEAIRRGGDHRFEYRALASDGRVVWLQDSVRVVPAQGGSPPYLLGLTLELAERTAASVPMGVCERAGQTAEDYKRADVEFLATITHELRTPLASVLGWARMLRSAALDREQTERALASIERNAEALMQLVERLFDRLAGRRDSAATSDAG